MRSDRAKITTENIVAVILFVFFIIFPALASTYKVLNFANFLSTVLLALSLTLIWGYTGIFSFGQALFFGIGGYVYGILALQVGNPAFTPVALVLGILAGALVAAFLGYFMFYGGVNDVFVGLITLCSTLVVETFMAQTAGSQWKVGKVLLGGFNGINGIPAISFGQFELTDVKFYYFVAIVVSLIYIGLRLLLLSRWGYGLLAIRENRERTRLFGYNVPKIQTLAFSLGGALASLAGIIHATWGGYMTPSTMGLSAATLPVILVAAGGRNNFTAGMLFALLYSWVSQFLSSQGTQYALVILGAALVLVVRFVPEGVFVGFFNLSDRLLLRKGVQDAKIEEGTHERSAV